MISLNALSCTLKSDPRPLFFHQLVSAGGCIPSLLLMPYCENIHHLYLIDQRLEQPLLSFNRVRYALLSVSVQWGENSQVRVNPILILRSSN